MNTLRLSFALLVLGLLCACGDQPSKPVQPLTDQQIMERMEDANRHLAHEEEMAIVDYVRRHQLETVATGTGLRYQVLGTCDGPLIQEGQTVTLSYELYDLDDEVLYHSDNDGLMRFMVGRSDVPSGLDEAVRQLHVGDSACVIVPSHLGYGLMGDKKAIPSWATLIYRLKIIKVD